MATIGQYLQHTRYAVPFFLGGAAPAVAGAGYKEYVVLIVFAAVYILYYYNKGYKPLQIQIKVLKDETIFFL